MRLERATRNQVIRSSGAVRPVAGCYALRTPVPAAVTGIELHTTLAQNLMMGAIFAVGSIGRSDALRRLFEIIRDPSGLSV